MADKVIKTIYTTLKVLIFFLYIQHCFAQDDIEKGLENSISSDNITELNNNEITIENSTQPATEKLRITVYYETLCPGSMEFLGDTLPPVIDVLGSYIHVHLVPYGHVKEEKVGDVMEVKCQHGPNECRGNKIHACVVDSIKNNTEAVLFNICLVNYSIDNYPMKEPYDTALDFCGDLRKVNISEIKNCLDSGKGDTLFKTYGEETTEFYKQYDGDTLVKPYVPYVVFENAGSSKTKEQKDEFMQNVCAAIKPKPKQCDDHEKAQETSKAPII